MGMPTDAINAFRAFSPVHLWVMNETSGSTFQDYVNTNPVSLTAGSTTAMNWETLSVAGQGFGGPQTAAPHFDGTANSACTVPGKSLGGLASWSMFAWVVAESTAGTIYSEGSATSTEHFVIRWSGATTFVNYKDAGHNVTLQSGSSTGSSLGLGFFGVTCDTGGNIRFYKSGVPAYTSNPSGFPTTPSAWTSTVTTNVGWDPQGLAVPFLGTIAWVVLIPSFLTDLQVLSLTQSLSPNPPNCNTWSSAASVSGVPFPYSEFWNSKLPDNTTLDPNSFAKITNWASRVQVGTTLDVGLGGGSSSMYDAQRSGPFPGIPYLDTFDRTAEDPLSDGGKWLAGAPFGVARLRTNGSVAVIHGTVDLATSGASWGTPFSPPLFVYAYFATNPPGTSSYSTMLTWLSNGVGTPTNGYALIISGQNPVTWQIVRYDNASSSAAGVQLATGPFSWSNGDGMGIAILDNGLIQFFSHCRTFSSPSSSGKSWLLMGSTVDNTYSSATGFVGAVFNSSAAQMNSFGGGAGYAGWVPLKDEFFNNDQRQFLNSCNAPPSFQPSTPQPTGSGNDSLGCGVELDRGRQWDGFEAQAFGPISLINRRPVWPPQIQSTTVATASGNLAPGWYFYAWATVTVSGHEGTGYAGGTANDVNLTGVTTGGTVTFSLEVDKNNWRDPPAAYRLYRRGPYTASASGTISDFGLLTSVAASVFNDYTVGGATFADDGTLTPDTTQKPYAAITSNAGSATPVFLVSGTASIGSTILNVRAPVGTGSPLASQDGYAPTHPTYGIPNYDSRPLNVLLNGGGANQETIYIAPGGVLNDTQIQLAKPLANQHLDGESFTVSSQLGAHGTALVADVTTLGGGGSWDWYHNAAFNPDWSPSNTSNNGESATSRPNIAGNITFEEAINAVNTPTSIPHVLAFAQYASIQAFVSHRWPAHRNDGAASGNAVNLFREGIRFRLPAGFDANQVTYSQRSSIVSAFQHAFVVALRDYGAIDNDSSPNGLFYVEDNGAEVGRNDFLWILGGLASSSSGVASILDFMFKPPVPITGNTSANSTTVTAVSSFTGISANQWINNPTVLNPMTQVQSTNPGSSTLVLTQAATATATGVTLYPGLMYQLQVIQSYRYPAKTDSYATFTATTTQGSAVLTNVSDVSKALQGLVLSDLNHGAIPYNATIVSTDGVSQITMSAPALAFASGLPVTAGRRSNRTDVGTLYTVGFQQLVPY